jgi:hypothetical protein
MTRLIIIILIGLSCRGSKVTSGSSTCAKELKTAAAGNWHYKKECNCYESTENFDDKLNASKSCIKTLNAEQIKSILGEPTAAPTMSGSTTIFRYRLAPCEMGKCVLYEFHFDSSMKVIGFTTMAQTSTTHH